MEDPVRTSQQVDDPQAASIIADPAQLRFLSPFIGRARRASEVARELGVPLTTLLYRVRKMKSVGLLRTDRVERRAGSPLSYYRAVADTFFVPFEATTAETLQALLKGWEEPWLSMFHVGYAFALEQAGPDWGVRVWRDDAGEVRVTPAVSPKEPWEAAAPATPAVLDELVPDLRLGREDAKALQRDLLDLLGRYSGRGGEPYFLRLMLTPLPEQKKVLP